MLEIKTIMSSTNTSGTIADKLKNFDKELSELINSGWEIISVSHFPYKVPGVTPVVVACATLRKLSKLER